MNNLKANKTLLEFIKKNHLLQVVEVNIKKMVELPRFFSTVAVKNGTIYYHSETNFADMIHEIGHLLTIPPELRCLYSGDFTKSQEKAIDKVGFDLLVNKYGFLRLVDNELAATAYTYCLCKELGINTELAFSTYSSIDSPLSTLKLETANMFSCQLYYAGLIATKDSTKLIKYVF